MSPSLRPKRPLQKTDGGGAGAIAQFFLNQAEKASHPDKETESATLEKDEVIVFCLLNFFFWFGRSCYLADKSR